MQRLRAIAQQAKGVAINKAQEESTDKVIVFTVSFVANNQAYTKPGLWCVAHLIWANSRRCSHVCAATALVIFTQLLEFH